MPERSSWRSWAIFMLVRSGPTSSLHDARRSIIVVLEPGAVYQAYLVAELVRYAVRAERLDVAGGRCEHFIAQPHVASNSHASGARPTR